MLETRRLRAARITILVLLLFLSALALWQCAEGSLKRSSVLGITEILGLFDEDGSPEGEGEQRDNSVEPNGFLLGDPLAIGQEGIVLMDANDEMSILWYQSIWDASQSRILIERSLVLQGWQSMSTDDEPVMTFVYAPRGFAGGGSLLVSFYSLEEGCSILIELL